MRGCIVWVGVESDFVFFFSKKLLLDISFWGGEQGQWGKGAVSGRLSGGACEIHRLRRLRREPTGERLSRSYRLAHWFRNLERTQPPSPAAPSVSHPNKSSKNPSLKPCQVEENVTK